MKTRLAKKIINTTAVFSNWDSNYQPYPVSQQQKALKTMKIPMSVRKTILEFEVYGKLLKEYMRYNPFAIARAMESKGMCPSNMKEYRMCMRKLLKQ